MGVGGEDRREEVVWAQCTEDGTKHTRQGQVGWAAWLDALRIGSPDIRLTALIA